MTVLIFFPGKQLPGGRAIRLVLSDNLHMAAVAASCDNDLPPDLFLQFIAVTDDTDQLVVGREGDQHVHGIGEGLALVEGAEAFIDEQ